MFGCKGLFPAKAGGHGHRSALGSAAGRGVGPHGKEQGLISGKSRLVKYYSIWPDKMISSRTHGRFRFKIWESLSMTQSFLEKMQVESGSIPRLDCMMFAF